MLKLFKRNSSLSSSSPEPVSSSSSSNEKPQLRGVGAFTYQGKKQFQNEDKIRFHLDTNFALVCDGHSGQKCSTFIQDNLGNKFSKAMPAKILSDNNVSDEVWEAAVKVALPKCFKELDTEFLRGAKPTDDESAASAICCAVHSNRVVIGHIGVCSALLIRNSDGHTSRLTTLHNVDNKEELDRVFEECDEEIKNIELRLRDVPLRAFGDFKYKGLKIVTVNPIIESLEVEKDWSILLCTDGLLEYMKEDEVGKFISKKMTEDDFSPQTVVEDLLQSALKNDDCSAILLMFS